MAFQNKGSSIFEYGSHLPLVKLSGYTLCVELLIKKYLTSIKNDMRYSTLLLFLFDINNINSIKEPSFNNLLNTIQNKIPEIGEEIAKYVYNEISSILDGDKIDLFDYFENSLKLLLPKQININDNNIYLSKSSLFGIFHRKLMICYNHSSFSTFNKFLKNIKTYYKNNKCDDNVLSTLKYPYDLDNKIYESCVDNSYGYGNNNNNNNKLLFENISNAFPELPSIHYLNMIINMNNYEYIKSLSYLHKYFDFVTSSFKINWNNIINDKNKQNKINDKKYKLLLQEKRKKMQYSLLCKAIFYGYFGHFNLAIKQITEALQRAQNIGDRTCVSSTLYLLVEFLYNQSGNINNINLIKQIYENCIQNQSNNLLSIHIYSLIGLTKLNLYHISMYNTKSRPWYLWKYLYFANKIIINNNKMIINDIYLIRGNAWNLYGNYQLSSIQYEICILLKTSNYNIVSNYLRYHCSYNDVFTNILSQSTIQSTKKYDLIKIILLLSESINCKNLSLSDIYQTRLSELIPACKTKDNFFLYLEMMYLHSQIRFEHKQYMEASRIINNLISLCNQRSLQSITTKFYLFLSKIHLKSHSNITQVMSYVLKAWSICKSYHFYYWLPQCVIQLAKLHLKLNNIKQSFNLIQKYLPIILKKNNYLIIESYINLAKCCLYNNQMINSIQYFHIARIWCLKLTKTNNSFKNSHISKELSTEIYYFLARLYENIGDTPNRDKAAHYLFV